MHPNGIVLRIKWKTLWVRVLCGFLIKERVRYHHLGRIIMTYQQYSIAVKRFFNFKLE